MSFEDNVKDLLECSLQTSVDSILLDSNLDTMFTFTNKARTKSVLITISVELRDGENCTETSLELESLDEKLLSLDSENT